MEHRIKILYSLTILAILAFLGMQVYWLYVRYEFSVQQYEDDINEKVLALLVDYNAGRYAMRDSSGLPTTRRSMYNMDYSTKSDVKLKATITTQVYSAHELLGIDEHRLLTPEEQDRVAKMITDNVAPGDTVSKSYDASNAPDDGVVWVAMRHAETEQFMPFSAASVDSLLCEYDIDADVSLVVTDTMVWVPSLERHRSLFVPKVSISSPYSELERKSVVIECRIPVSEVFKKMGSTLVIALSLSLLLILCLVWQFSTILKLNRIDKMRNTFVTTMIHELKRPLSTLKMCISGIENEQMMADKAVKAEMMAETRTALDNLSAYFSKLRDITFNNVEQIPLNISTIDLHRLFDAVSGNVAVPAGKVVNIANEIPEGMLISADRSHLFNVFNNLVENAVKYSGPTVDITATATRAREHVEISISDNGYGIEGADIKHVFQRFYRGRRSSADQPGMGLGLAYVKLLVEAHGGTVEVKSAEGRGTCFTITLPQ